MKVIASRRLHHREGPDTPQRIIEADEEFDVDKGEAERLIARGHARPKAAKQTKEEAPNA